MRRTARFSAPVSRPEHYREFSLPYLKQICAALPPETPKTVFAKGAWFALRDLSELPCQVLGLDWNMAPKWAREQVGDGPVLQGNFDPCNLYAQPQVIENEAIKMIGEFGKKHIVNLGHGVYPDTPLDGVRVFVDTVKAFRYPV